MVTTPVDSTADHIQMNFHIKGKDHTFKIHKQRFEKTVDGIDKMIHSGRHDVDSITRKFGNRFAAPPVAAKKVKAAPVDVVKAAAKSVTFDKAGHVRHIMNEYPGLGAGAIAKHASQSSGGGLTYANAFYLAKKEMKNR